MGIDADIVHVDWKSSDHLRAVDKAEQALAVRRSRRLFNGSVRPRHGIAVHGGNAPQFGWDSCFKSVAFVLQIADKDLVAGLEIDPLRYQIIAPGGSAHKGNL